MAFNFIKTNILGTDNHNDVRSVAEQKQIYLTYKKNKSAIKDAYLERKNVVLNQIFEYAEIKHKQLLEHNNLMEILQGKFDIRNQKIAQTSQQVLGLFNAAITKLKQQVVKTNLYSNTTSNKYNDELRIIDQLNLLAELQQNSNAKVNQKIQYIEDQVIGQCLLKDVGSLDKELENVRVKLMQIKIQLQKIEFQSCYELQQVSNHVMNRKSNDDFLQKVLKYVRISEKVYQVQMDAAQYTVQFIKVSCQKMNQMLDNIGQAVNKYVSIDGEHEHQNIINRIVELGQHQNQNQNQNINQFDVCQILDDSDTKMIQSMLGSQKDQISLLEVSEMLVGLEKIKMEVYYQSLIRNKYEVKLLQKNKSVNGEVYLSIDGFFIMQPIVVQVDMINKVTNRQISIKKCQLRLLNAKLKALKVMGTVWRSEMQR